jgi:hypothetical protein
MWLPTRAQVDSASRHAITIVSTATLIFGLQAKGFDPQVIISMIQALGPTVNDLVNLVGAAAAAYAMLKASHSASPIEQAKSVEASGAVVVTSPSIAAATPNNPNIVSSADMKVVLK